MIEPRSALEPALASMAQRWQDSGIPTLYVGGDASASRERARCIRAFLYPKPDIEVAGIESIEIQGTETSLPARVVRPRVRRLDGGVLPRCGWVLAITARGPLHAHAEWRRRAQRGTASRPNMRSRPLPKMR
jgi:hypothetical protein